MTSYRPGEVVGFVGTMAIVVGAVVLIPNTANPSTHVGLYIIGGLLVLGGLLLRIESAILRAGRVDDQPRKGPAQRPLRPEPPE
jgi:hypothetical protein